MRTGKIVKIPNMAWDMAHSHILNEDPIFARCYLNVVMAVKNKIYEEHYWR